MEIKSGVYQIRNTINNKRYIGSAIDIKGRWRIHKRHLRKGIHGNDYLQKAWNKSGEIVFEFSILEKVNDLTQLISREQHYKDLYRSHNRKYGYDICKIAGSSLGYKHTEKTKKHLSEIRMGKEPWNKGLEGFNGKQPWNKGKTLPEEYKAAISKTLKKRFENKENHPMYGTHRPDETREKIAEKARIRNAGSGNPMYGKHHSIEARQKIKDYWAKRKANEKEV
jgi:group I intron endonuclease